MRVKHATFDSREKLSFPPRPLLHSTTQEKKNYPNPWISPFFKVENSLQHRYILWSQLRIQLFLPAQFEMKSPICIPEYFFAILAGVSQDTPLRKKTEESQ